MFSHSGYNIDVCRLSKLMQVCDTIIIIIIILVVVVFGGGSRALVLNKQLTVSHFVVVKEKVHSYHLLGSKY